MIATKRDFPAEATTCGVKGDVGAVLVCGGGITGIQAALDMAESGFKVYLLDKDSAIGGRMAGPDRRLRDVHHLAEARRVRAQQEHPDHHARRHRFD